VVALDSSPHLLRGKRLQVEFHWSPVDPKKQLAQGQQGRSLDRVHPKDTVGELKPTPSKPWELVSAKPSSCLIQRSGPARGSLKQDPHQMRTDSPPDSPVKFHLETFTSPRLRITEQTGDPPSLQEESLIERLPTRPHIEVMRSVCRVFYRHLKRLYLMNEPTDVERATDYHYTTEDGRETDHRVLRSDFYLKKLSQHLLHK